MCGEQDAVEARLVDVMTRDGQLDERPVYDFTEVLSDSSCCLLFVCHKHAKISVTSDIGRLQDSAHVVAVECLHWLMCCVSGFATIALTMGAVPCYSRACVHEFDGQWLQLQQLPWVYS